MAFSMFSVLPVPRVWDEKALNLVLAFLPVLGAVLGLINCGLAELLPKTAVHPALSAAIMAVVYFGLTGFIHLDGYMDVSDAVLSRRGLEERLRILKDPHAGAFAVLAAVFLILFVFACFFGMADEGKSFAGFCCVMAASRGMASLELAKGKLIARSGLGFMFRENMKNRHVAFIIIMIAAAAFVGCFISLTVVFAVTSAVAMSILACLICVKSLGGVSGDTAGFSVVLSEMLGILILAIL